MTKVCMVVHQYYHHDGRVRRYAESLIDAGIQVDVLCPRDQGCPPVTWDHGIRIVTVPISRGYKGLLSYLWEYIVALVLFTFWLLYLYIRNRYQIIHIHNMPDFLVLAGLIPKLLGAKVILDIHDPMPEFYMSKYDVGKRSLVVRGLEQQEQFSARIADAIIVANHNFEQNLVKRGTAPDKITVVNNVADPKIFNRDAFGDLREQPQPHFTLLYPGTIAPRYNLEIPIRALPQLVEISQAFRLQLVGPKVTHVDELLELATKLGVANYVDFVPSIPIRAVAQMMACAGVGIYTAQPGPHMSIATPTKVLEYAAMGLPIVASRLKILEDLFPDSALLFFEPGNVDEFAKCVLHIYQNPQCRKQLVQNADRFFVQKHRWSNERSTYLNLLRRLGTVQP